MWQLGIVGALLLGIIFYWGGDIARWHARAPAEELNAIASWASIYGFGISCLGLMVSGYAAWGIRQIKVRFLVKARLPVLARRLQKNASELSDMAGQSPIPQQDKTDLFSSIAANLNAVRRHAPTQIKKIQKQTSRAFDQLSLEANNAPNGSLGELDTYWNTYQKIQLLKLEIDHYLAEEKWEN